jgi:hypothetical protein
MRDMTDLNPSHHFFRHIAPSRMDGDFIDPSAFWLREKDGKLEEGLSVNWLEYFKKSEPQDAIAPLMDILANKGFTVRPSSKFALLNVGAAKDAAARYTSISIVLDEEVNDPSHSLVKGYEAYNKQVAEELQKVIIDAYPANPDRARTSGG